MLKFEWWIYYIINSDLQKFVFVIYLIFERKFLNALFYVLNFMWSMNFIFSFYKIMFDAYFLFMIFSFFLEFLCYYYSIKLPLLLKPVRIYQYLDPLAPNTKLFFQEKYTIFIQFSLLILNSSFVNKFSYIL